MNKPIISIKLSPRDYSGLVDLGNRVFNSMSGSLLFVTPSPTLLSLQSAITNVVTAIGVWGPRSNRGSHFDLVDLREKALNLQLLLKAEAQYVQNTAQIASGTDYVAMATIIESSGFQLANTKTPQGVLQMVQNYHYFTSRKLMRNQVKIKWKKPLNVTSANNVKSYKVFRGSTNVLTAAIEINTPTKTEFVDTNTTGATQTWFYWVLAVNAFGDGVPTVPLEIIVPAS